MSKQTESLKLALEALEDISSHYMSLPKKGCMALAAIEEALADSALDRMAENARELGLDYEPPCKTGSQCTSKCQQCEQPAQEPVAWIVWNGWRKESVFFTYEGAEEFRAASQRHDDLSGNLAAYRVAPLYTSPQPVQQQEPNK